MRNILTPAFSMPPAKAVEYIKRKGYDFSWNWFDIWRDAHAKAFTVAKALDADVLRHIRIAVNEAVMRGDTLAEFKKKLIASDKDVKSFFQGANPRKLETVYKTNMQTAYMAGRCAGQKEAADDLPYWQYLTVDDSRVRDSHHDLHGKIYRANDPIWEIIYPPNGWGCRCRVRALSQRYLDRHNLKVESSEGRIVEREETVRSGGEKKTVTARGVALGDGKTVWVSPGWDYNAATEAWMPDVNKFHPFDAKRFIEAGITGPDYKRFLEAKGKIGGQIPIAMLPQEYMNIIKAKTNVMWLSSDTLFKNVAHHDELLITEYLNIQDVIKSARSVAVGIEDPSLMAFLGGSNRGYFMVIKCANNGREIFVQSYHRYSKKKISGENKWRIIK